MDFKTHLMEKLGISLSHHQQNLFALYFEALLAYNKHTNITRITDEQEVFYKHFYDSLSIVKVIDFTNVSCLCDMGAGAGFPSIPLKIAFPHLKITIIDSLNKRIKFLQQLTKTLNLEFVELFHDRIENYALKNTQKFDIVTARALGSIPLILEMGVPMLKNKGHFIAYKSRSYKEELDKSENAIKTLNVRLNKIVDLNLPHQMGERTILDFIKTKHVTGYPRSYSIMEKKPL